VPNSDLDPWQRPDDGFPSDEYFAAVSDALRSAGVPLLDWGREEDWEVNYQVHPNAVAASPLSWAEHGLYVSWRCDQDDEPLTDGFTAAGGLSSPGWYWVPYSKPRAGGDYAKEFELHPLAEPEDVAAAVWALLHPDAARTVPDQASTADRPTSQAGGA
jgi:hypothetical protein